MVEAEWEVESTRRWGTGKEMERLISSGDMHWTDDGLFFVLRPSIDGRLCGGTGFNGSSCTLAESLYNIWDWCLARGKSKSPKVKVLVCCRRRQIP